MTRSTSPTVRRSLIASIATILASLALLALAACGTSTTPATQTTLPDAATVLQQAETASYKNVTFNVTLTETVNGTTLNGTGTGAETITPKKLLQMTLTVPIPGSKTNASIKVEQIIDYAGKEVYTKNTGPGQSGKWTKESLAKYNSSTNGSVDASAVGDLSSFKNPTMIGADTVNGVSVWHLQSTQSSSSTTGSTGSTGASATATAKATTSTAAATSTTDLYLRQDNNLPERMTINTSSGATPMNITIDFTKYDGDVTITIPHV